MAKLTLTRLVALISFIALFAMAVRTAVDTDMYWHLRTGQYILETRSVPQTDPYSSTVPGTPWVDVYWLAQVLMYVTYGVAGYPGLSLLVAVLVTLAGVFVWKQLSGGVFVRAFILILVAATSGAVWTARPQMVTLVLTAVVGYLLYLYKWKQIDRLWVLPILFVIWANTHGGYIAGFMLIGALLAGEVLNRMLAWLGVTGVVAVDWRRWRKLLIITLVSVFALLINPFTIGTWLLPVKTVNIGVLQDFIQEWQSPNFHELFQQPMIWLLLLTLMVIGWSGRKLDATDAVTVALFAYITFLARRNIGLFALVCAPVLSRHVEALWQQSRWSARRLSRGQPILNGVLLLVITAAAMIKVAVPLWPSTLAKAEQEILPLGAINWIEQNRPAREMFNSYNWGGYLMWRLWPQYPVYADGRTDVYDDVFLREYLRVTQAQDDWQAVLERRKVGFVLIEAGSGLDTALRRESGWHEVYRDSLAVIYVRGRA